jgi:hypothetical protein
MKIKKKSVLFVFSRTTSTYTLCGGLLLLLIALNETYSTGIP